MVIALTLNFFASTLQIVEPSFLSPENLCLIMETIVVSW
jgi:hypothetical protein